jgi:hypothetical protein
MHPRLELLETALLLVLIHDPHLGSCADGVFQLDDERLVGHEQRG